MYNTNNNIFYTNTLKYIYIYIYNIYNTTQDPREMGPAAGPKWKTLIFFRLILLIIIKIILLITPKIIIFFILKILILVKIILFIK